MRRYFERILTFKAEAVAIVVGTTLHRGYRDASGVFTLEGDNIDSADERIFLPTEIPDDLEGKLDLCERCFHG